VDFRNGILHVRVLPAGREVEVPIRSWGLEEETSIDSCVTTNCAALKGIDDVRRTCQVAAEREDGLLMLVSSHHMLLRQTYLVEARNIDAAKVCTVQPARSFTSTGDVV
jgi:hypothetical protein